ncbi:MAG: sigma-70 family RNA polymerase sigma factor [Phycisphaerales bacterium]
MEPTLNPALIAESEQRALLERLRAGDDRAYDELVELAGPRMLSVARGLLQSDTDAEDAVQDAFLSAFKALPAFDGRARLTTWLHQITVNACLMKLRTKRRRPEQSIEGLLPRFSDDGHQQNPRGAWNAGGPASIQASEVRALVLEKIQELPEQHRLVLVLRDVEGLDTEETAAVLETTSETVRTRLHRARQALKGLLDPYFAEDSQ